MLACIGLKVARSLSHLTGTSILPRTFVRDVHQLARRQVPTSRTYFTENGVYTTWHLRLCEHHDDDNMRHDATGDDDGQIRSTPGTLSWIIVPGWCY